MLSRTEERSQQESGRAGGPVPIWECRSRPIRKERGDGCFRCGQRKDDQPHTAPLRPKNGLNGPPAYKPPD